MQRLRVTAYFLVRLALPRYCASHGLSPIACGQWVAASDIAKPTCWGSGRHPRSRR